MLVYIKDDIRLLPRVKYQKGALYMKKLLLLVLALVLAFSVIGTAFAESEEPEFKRPVQITAVDENGEAIDGVELQLSNDETDMVKTVNADGQTLLLPEGEYALAQITVPDGFLVDTEALAVTVERPLDAVGTFIGNCVYDHNHTVCTNAKHAGIELFSLQGKNGETIVAYCFNHGLKNPNGETVYTAYTADADALFRYARNKNDDITKQELYDHVLSIIYHAKDLEAFDLDEQEIRFFTYMAIKTFTDPKCFYEFDAEGKSLLIRDENNKPVLDENGKYQFAEGGCVLGAMIHHVVAEKHEFPQNYKDAYNYLLNVTDHPDYNLYFYYPEGYDIDSDQSYQILMSAKEVPAQEIRVALRPAAQFLFTLNWDDANNKDRIRPAADSVASLMHLFANGTDVTEQYADGIAVVEQNGVYAVSIAGLPKLDADGNEIVYTLHLDLLNGYITDSFIVENGDTVTLRHLVLQKIDRPPITPITPIKPIKPIKPVKPVR